MALAMAGRESLPDTSHDLRERKHRDIWRETKEDRGRETVGRGLTAKPGKGKVAFQSHGNSSFPFLAVGDWS